MAKSRIILNVSKNKIEKILPPHLFRLVSLSNIKEDKVNIVLFSGDMKYTTTSSNAKKLLRNIKTSGPLLVIGESFTIEADEFLSQISDYYYCEKDVYWTDQAYKNSRQGKF